MRTKPKSKIKSEAAKARWARARAAETIFARDNPLTFALLKLNRNTLKQMADVFAAAHELRLKAEAVGGVTVKTVRLK